MGAGTTDGVRQFLSNVRYLGQIVLDTIIVDRYKYVPAEVTYDEVNFEKTRDSLLGLTLFAWQQLGKKWIHLLIKLRVCISDLARFFFQLYNFPNIRKLEKKETPFDSDIMLV